MKWTVIEIDKQHELSSNTVDTYHDYYTSTRENKNKIASLYFIFSATKLILATVSNYCFTR